MLLPDFIVNNNSQSDEAVNETLKGRKIVSLAEIDVYRDIFELNFILNSDEDPNEIKYFLELLSWKERSM